MMKCNTKMMLAIALALAFALVVVYWAVPQARGSLATLAVAASALICPISMLFMMRGMQSKAAPENAQSSAADESKA